MHEHLQLRQVKILVAQDITKLKTRMQEYCRENLNSKKAETRSPADKEKIDKYVRDSVGFAAVDDVVRQAMEGSCPMWNEKQEQQRERAQANLTVLLTQNAGLLSREQIKELSEEQIGWFSREQIGSLSEKQVGWLSGEQIGSLLRRDIDS